METFQLIMLIGTVGFCTGAWVVLQRAKKGGGKRK